MWSFINYRLLESIIDEYTSYDDGEWKKLKCYIAELEQFARTTSIPEYIYVCQVLTTTPRSKQESLTLGDTHSPNPELFSCLKTEIELTKQHEKLSHVLKLQEHLMKHFSLYHPTLLLGRVTTGSVVIAWHFPAVETERIFSTAACSSVFYKEHNIMQVTLDGHLVYSDTMTAMTHGQQEVRRCYNHL